MSLVLGLLGLGISLALTIRNARGEKLSQLVFLFSAVHLFYIFPKVIALSESGTQAAQYFQANGTTFIVAYMALACYLATIITYSLLAPGGGLAYGINGIGALSRRLRRFSVVIGCLGLLGFLGLMARSGGLQNYFFGLAFYEQELTGITVWLIFLSRFIYPAIAAMALIATLRPTRLTLTLLALLALFPLMNIVFLFRRSDLLLLGFIAAYALAMSGRMRVNRMYMLAALGAAAVSITLFPYLRQESISAVTGWQYSSADMTLRERIEDSFDVSDSDEIVRAASAIDLSYKTGRLDFGAFVWDSMVHQFIPATLVGAEAKQSLLLGQREGHDDVQSYFNEQSFFYVAPMGFAQSYEQFGLFGWIIFAGFGAMIAGVERRSWKVSNQIFLMIAIPIVCLAASNDIGSMPARLFTFWVLTRFLGRVRFLVFAPSERKQFGRARIFTLPSGGQVHQ